MTEQATTPASTLHQENASNHDTTQDSFIPPGVTDEQVESDAADQLETLIKFLDNHFPGEMQRTNRQVPETPVQTTMRLMLGLSGKANLTAVTRCDEQYCNKTQGHAGVHGMVHYE